MPSTTSVLFLFGTLSLVSLTHASSTTFPTPSPIPVEEETRVIVELSVSFSGGFLYSNADKPTQEAFSLSIRRTLANVGSLDLDQVRIQSAYSGDALTFVEAEFAVSRVSVATEFILLLQSAPANIFAMQNGFDQSTYGLAIEGDGKYFYPKGCYASDEIPIDFECGLKDTEQLCFMNDGKDAVCVSCDFLFEHDCETCQCKPITWIIICFSVGCFVGLVLVIMVCIGCCFSSCWDRICRCTCCQYGLEENNDMPRNKENKLTPKSRRPHGAKVTKMSVAGEACPLASSDLTEDKRENCDEAKSYCADEADMKMVPATSEVVSSKSENKSSPGTNPNASPQGAGVHVSDVQMVTTGLNYSCGSNSQESVTRTVRSANTRSPQTYSCSSRSDYRSPQANTCSPTQNAPVMRPAIDGHKPNGKVMGAGQDGNVNSPKPKSSA